jgi:hypothetical protein
MKGDRLAPQVAAGTFGRQSEIPAGVVGRGLWVFVPSLVVSLLLRALYLAQPWRVDQATLGALRSDEGALGLMIRHVLAGARPIFVYGIFHQGAVEAYLGVPPFLLFGETLVALRLTPAVLAVGSIGLTYLIARQLYPRGAALLAASLIALPSTFVFVWGCFAVPGYVGLVFLLLAMVYATLLVLRRPTRLRLACLGFAAGLAVWNNQIALPYVAVCALAVAVWAPLRSQHVAIALLAWVVGVAPLLYGNIVIPFASVRQLGRKAYFAITLAKSQVRAHRETTPQHYRSLPLLEVLGAQQDQDGTWSVVGSAGAAVLVFGLVGAIRRWRASRQSDPDDFRRHTVLLALVAVVLVVGIGGFARQPIGRYQLFLYPLLSVLTAGWIARAAPRLAVPLVALVVVGRALTIVAPPPADASVPDDEVLRALGTQGIRYGYGAGGTYDLVFRSGEQVILVPLDHSRYTPYERSVAAAERIAYIYRDDQEHKPAHAAFMEALAERGVRYRQMDIGTHHVLYDFEPRQAITPAFIDEVRATFRKMKGGDEDPET